MTTREVILDGGSPWGFRLHGGADINQPLRISRVNPGSKAALRAIREGDLITSINGQSTKELSNAEAHNLLKTSGDTIKLGLNENCNGGSPKRRQYKTVLQETHSEIKKSCVTSYKVTATRRTQNETNNEICPSKAKEIPKLNGDSQNFPVTASSTCSSNSSTFTEEGIDKSALCAPQTNSGEKLRKSDIISAMADNVTRSQRRRRARNNRKKAKILLEKTEVQSSMITEIKCCDNSKTEIEEVIAENYQVDFPDKRGKSAKLSKKSKSLDDDELPKIQEVSDTNTLEESENKAIISEADSDVEWETATDLKIPKKQSGNILSLEKYSAPQITLMSPKDELNLRKFLQSLNLVNSPEEAIKLVYDNSQESIKARKARKRAALEQYFFPIYQNPRYLDAISEETSDISDKEQQTATQKLPELEAPKKSDRLKNRMQSHFCAPISQPRILVDTKIIDSPCISEGIISTDLAETSSEAELVFLGDSSPDEDEAEITAERNDEIHDNEHASRVVREDDCVIFECNDTSIGIHSTKVNNDISGQLTPPPTPDDISPKNEISERLVDNNDALETFIKTASSYLSNGNIEGLRSIIKDPRYHNLHRNLRSEIESNLNMPSRQSNKEIFDGNAGFEQSAVSLTSSKLNFNFDIAKNKEFLQFAVKFQPLTLRELCLNALMFLPFGIDILQELSEICLNIDSFTAKFPNKTLLNFAPNLVAFISDLDNFNSGPMRDILNEKSDVNDERLHETVSEINMKNVQSNESGCNDGNRLLAILRNEASLQKSAMASDTSVENKSDYLYNLKSNQSRATFPRISEKNAEDSARLNAKDLAEWLHLARNNKNPTKLTGLQHPTNNRAQAGNSSIYFTRRHTLPPKFYERQMLVLLEKEREVQRELENLEEEKRKLSAEMAPSRQFQPDDFHISRKGDYAENKTRPVSMPIVSEFFRQQMFEEYMDKVAKMEERKQLKVIKVTSVSNQTESTSIETATKQISGIEEEFMDKVKEKRELGKLEKLKSDVMASSDTSFLYHSDDDFEPILVIDGDSLKGAHKLPKHLKEFIDITKHAAENKTESDDGVWTPGQKQSCQELPKLRIDTELKSNDPISPVWSPKSASSSPIVDRKEFRPVKFDSPVPSRRNESFSPQTRLPTSYSSPASGFNDYSPHRLPKVQNPTITLLQKAREGQLPRGASYLDHDPRRYNGLSSNDIHIVRNDYTSESDNERQRRMASRPKTIEGIGPTTRDGMPLVLRSEVRDSNQSKWYKKMYDTIHKQKPHRDEYVTVRYRNRRAQYPYTSGYLSEPEPGAYDSDYTDYKYATLDRRRLPFKNKENDFTMSSTVPRNTAPKSTSAEFIVDKRDTTSPPGRIENYTPGHSSISEREAKEWWDEVMDIFDGHLEQQKRPPQNRSFINQVLKESGYESDSTLVFRRRDDTAQQLSPKEQKEAYIAIQKGGDVPLQGLRKPAPERPKEPEPPVPPPKGQHDLRELQQESPRKYVENEVTIHYKTPVRQEIKEYLSEDELAYRQAEAMKKIYQEERRRKYLQELQDMNNRRHTDNFIASQKSPISLNRYDDFGDDLPATKPRPRSPESRLTAKALYNFVGQSARELTFRKGDIIHVRRQVDKNWYEGELNAMVGLFPVNYVEIVPFSSRSTPRKSHEGQARAKYNFVAQTHLELSLAKGELVVVTRRVDDNWFEGRAGGRKGIFPVSYVDVLIDPSEAPPPSAKPVASPAAHSLLLNGSAGGKESMGSHSYTPQMSNITGSYHAKPVQVSSYGPLNQPEKNPINQALHIETQSEPVPYRALYKYLPQNDDELELLEGDTVYVLEKCDDGWYVGSSERTGAFGTFPGNYVEKI